MNFQELQSRLNQLGIVIKDKTLSRWATTKLITGPVRDPNPDRRGARWIWPEEAVEDAAAVWALWHLETYRTRPSRETIERVKCEAKELHEKYTTSLRLDGLPSDEFRRAYDTKGEKGTYLLSYGLHPLVILWTTTIEKVRHNVSIREHRKVTFDWARETAQGEAKLTFRGVRLEESDSNDLDLFVYRAASKSGQEFERKYYPNRTDSNDSVYLS